jgi:hypothetical protein
MSRFPEHDKLSAIQSRTQAIGEFIEWAGSQGVHLVRFDEDDRGVPVGFRDLLAEWAGIDMDTLKAEKRQMLDELRRANGG